MGENKSSISGASSYEEIGEFWDGHELTDFWDETKSVEFVVDIQSETTYYPVENVLSEKLVSIAERRGVSPETLLNLWVQEKIGDEAPAEYTP